MIQIGLQLAECIQHIKFWTDYVRKDLKDKNIQKLPGLVKRPKNKQKGSLEESCESLIVGTADGREERYCIRVIVTF